MHGFWHWLIWGAGYQLTSGPIPALQTATIFGFVIALYRKHTCHVDRCWRLTWRHTAAGDIVCRKHHPVPPKTHEQVIADHNDALAGVSGPETSNLGG